MLKAAQKKQYQRMYLTLLFIISTCSVQNQVRNVTSHRVFESIESNEQRKKIIDVYAEQRFHVGILKLNREHRYNTLTPNYIKNIRRCLESMDYEELVKVIYLTTGRGQQFCNGTDFRTLLHYKYDKNQKDIQDYMSDLYGLQTLVAKLNKPIISVAPGHAFNSGAALLAATGNPNTTLNTKLAFNEVSFGFVPHGGSSYYLSRLPGEIGTFLALTGLPITGVDAKELGLANDIIHNPFEYETEIQDAMQYFQMPLFNSRMMSNNRKDNLWRQQLKMKNEEEQEQMNNDIYERARKKKENLIFEEFVEPKDNIPSLTADSEYKYKQMMKDYNQRYEGRIGYLEHSEAIYHNHYDHLMGYLKSHTHHDFNRKERAFHNQIEIINRCFYSHTVEEIIENLRHEKDTPFAQKCLERMNSNSLLSMKLALKMLREAKNLDYKGCLQNELNVALNKVQDSEFDLGINEVLLKPTNVFKTDNPGFSREISNDQVLSYFQPNKYAEDIDLGIVEKAMLPTRFYYEKYTDTMRLWINESSTTQAEIREGFDEEVKEVLQTHGIDVRDRALTVSAVRNVFYQQEQEERREAEWNQRMLQFASDDKLRTQYFTHLKKEVDHFDHNVQDFYRVVNKKIQETFENAYIEKLQHVFDKSKEAHDLEKRRMFIKFKQFLFKSRILVYADQEFDRQARQLMSMPFKLPHLTEKWDTQSFRDMTHPDIEQSPLHYIAKAVGKINYTPVELTKAYVTNQNNIRQHPLDLFTFDQAELKKIRDDILEDPEKYERMMRKNNGTVRGTQSNKNQQKAIDDFERKYEEYEYWYRALNKGYNPHDSLPQYKLYLVYKDWVGMIEDKALNTLRVIVQRLLQDFEHQDNVNEVTDFGQPKGESKFATLKRLYSELNGGYTPNEKARRAIPEVPSLATTTRPLKDIEKGVSALLEQDPQVKLLIQSDFSTSNPLIQSLRQSFKEKFIEAIEFVLLNKVKGQNISQTLLQERLAGITSAKHATQRSALSLRVIDQYLNDQSNLELLKEAINIAKPYVFMNLQDKLEAESDKVFVAFSKDTTFQDVLEHYMFSERYPEVREDQKLHNLMNFNRREYVDDIFQKAHPEISERFFNKVIDQNLGEGLSLTANMTLQEKQEHLASVVKKTYSTIRSFRDKRAKKEESYERERESSRQRQLQNREKDEDQFDWKYYTEAELDQIADLVAKVERVQEDIKWMMETEIITTDIEQADWLRIYGKSITNYGLDMEGLFKSDKKLKVMEDVIVRSEEDLHKVFGGNKKLKYSDIADYANFLSNVIDQGGKIMEDNQMRQYYNVVTDAVLRQTSTLQPQMQVKAESIYNQIKENKVKFVKPKGERSYDITSELKDHLAIQHKIEERKSILESINLLKAGAPPATQALIDDIISSPSLYVDYRKLKFLILNKQYDKIEKGDFLDSKKIVHDVTHGKLLQDFVNEYHNTKLDVVSVAQIREIIDKAPISSVFTQRIKQQVKSVLDYINSTLQYIAHDRRQQITLGEYLSRHNYLNSASYEELMNDVVKNRIQEILGKKTDMENVDTIDWEFAGVRTNPIIHKIEDQKTEILTREGVQQNQAQSIQGSVKSMIASKGASDIDSELIRANLPTHQLSDTLFIEGNEVTSDLQSVLVDANKYVKLTPEFICIKNKFENDILNVYTSTEFDQEQIQQLVEKYTELRMTECMLIPGFTDKIKSNNGHLYLKLLKESIAKELNLDHPPLVSELTFAKKIERQKITDEPRVSVEGRYNFADLDNLNAIGYNKLEERAKNPDKNRDIAHDSIYDKLLAEFFLSKRGQYAASNELIEQLNEDILKFQFPEGHPQKLKHQKAKEETAEPLLGDINFTFRVAQQDADKKGHATMLAQDFPEMMELDIITSQALQNNKNGLAVQFRQDIPDDMLTIPEYFETFDVRKPAKKYVDDKLTQIIQEIFNTRRKLEKTLTRNELLAYDKILIKHLTKETLIPKLRKEIDDDWNQLNLFKQTSEMKSEGTENSFRQFLKSDITQQRDHNKSIKNEDSLYKFLAYSGMLEQKRRQNLNETRKSAEIAMSLHSFEEFYKRELQREAKREPREINPKDFEPKKGIDQSRISEGFKTLQDRKNDFYREATLYQENKKEQIERNQMFYILEQFYKDAREKKHDPLDKAQVAITDYFSNPENYYFFDKNKIQ